MSITGDFATLARMRKKLATSAELPTRAATAIAPVLEAATRAGFDEERSPSGKAWKADRPKTYALGTKSILRRSDSLFGTIKAVAEGARVVVSLGTDYLRYQLGKRDPLPVGRGRIPKPWSEKVRQEAERVFQEIFK